MAVVDLGGLSALAAPPRKCVREKRFLSQSESNTDVRLQHCNSDLVFDIELLDVQEVVESEPTPSHDDHDGHNHDGHDHKH